MVVSFNFLCRADTGNLDREIRNEQERAFLGELTKNGSFRRLSNGWRPSRYWLRRAEQKYKSDISELNIKGKHARCYLVPTLPGY